MSTPLRAVMIGHIVQIILQRIAHRIQLKLFFDLSEHVENRREVVPARRDSGQVFLNELLKVFGEGLLLGGGHGGDLLESVRPGNCPEMGNYTSLVRKFEARPLTQKEPDARTSRRHPVLPRRWLCEIDALHARRSMGIHEMRDSLPLGRGRHHFFPRRSFKAALSSMASAKSRSAGCSHPSRGFEKARWLETRNGPLSYFVLPEPKLGCQAAAAPF